MGHNNSSAAKSPAENSTDRSIPLSTEETNTEEPGTVIPTNGQGSNELSNHNIAADSGGSTNSSIITENNDAKAEKMVQGDHSIDQRKESDLNSEASAKCDSNHDKWQGCHSRKEYIISISNES